MASNREAMAASWVAMGSMVLLGEDGQVWIMRAGWVWGVGGVASSLYHL